MKNLKEFTWKDFLKEMFEDLLIFVSCAIVLTGFMYYVLFIY